MKAYPLISALLFILLMQIKLQGQIEVNLNMDHTDGQLRSDHLVLGGSNSLGRTIDVNNYYISIDGKPTIPVSGEFHYSRYPEKYWEESIQKMRAGGITMIATYVFWNIHEEQEGIFDWEGSKDLRKFVKLCAMHDFNVIVRIGPFCHGEIRNGGLPDWLLGRPLSIRSNDAQYLSYVERLFDQIGQQLEGLYFKDGGPVIGIQLENEYQHSAAPWGLTYPGQPHDWTASERDQELTQIGVGVAEGENPYADLGNEHMKVLKVLAQRAGILVPLYTATGWGNAAIIENETLPVTAAYPYPTWAPEQPSEFYLYTNLQQDPDYAPVRYHAEDYPYFAAELGGGIMNTYERRPIVPAGSLAPMINRFLGSGANGIGYYMYHGGSTPRGIRNYFNDVAVGCPIISYDFQAPIGEFGNLKPSFYRLKPLHLFLKSFGEYLAPMQVILPESQKLLTPQDDTTLRFSIRSDGESGFVFLNNFQDHVPTQTKENIQFKLLTASGEITIPEKGSLTLMPDENAILPFHLNLNGVLLNYATSQLLSKGGDPQNMYYVFFTIPGIIPEYSIVRTDGLSIQESQGCKILKNKERFLIHGLLEECSEFVVKSTGGKQISILTVPLDMAQNMYEVIIEGKEHLLFSKALVLSRERQIELNSFNMNKFEISVFPGLHNQPNPDQGHISVIDRKNTIFSNYEIDLPEYHADVVMDKIQSNKIVVTMAGYKPDHINDLFLVVDYYGDTGMGFMNGELVADHFFNGTKWIIGQKKFTEFNKEKEMVLYFRPLYNDAPFLKDLRESGIPKPEDVPGGFRLNQMEVLPEYKTTLSF